MAQGRTPSYGTPLDPTVQHPGFLPHRSRRGCLMNAAALPLHLPRPCRYGKPVTHSDMGERNRSRGIFKLLHLATLIEKYMLEAPINRPVMRIELDKDIWVCYNSIDSKDVTCDHIRRKL